jgi:tetratricopeptide (TPR) repeat protein
MLARHWTEAGEIELAIAEWSKAGSSAQARNAFSEALESYRQALALLSLLRESPERDDRELELRQAVLSMLYITRGWAALETIDATERAEVLAAKGGNLPQLGGWMGSRCFTAWVSGDLSTAIGLADRTLELRLREGSAIGLASAYMLQLLARYWIGDLAGAESSFTTGLAFFNGSDFRQDPVGGGVATFAYASWNAWILGRADVARERLAQMMAAVNSNNPHLVAFSGWLAAHLRVHLREYEQVEALSARTLELSEKHQFLDSAARSRCMLGQAGAQLGRAAEGIALIRDGIASILRLGTRLGISIFTAYLAEAQERAGATGQALETIEQALQANPDERAYLPEILRIRGELRLKHGQIEWAEADFREAIALAQNMGARAWELRTTTSLARLLAKEGRREEARAMLGEIYNWFTEGFDTADLKDAKALLDELAE